MSRAATIVELLSTGMSVNDVAEAVGCCGSNVYATARRNGIKIIRAPSSLEGKRAEIEKMISEGVAYREIARRLGADRNTVRSFCRANGLLLSEAQMEANHDAFSASRMNDDAVADKLFRYGLVYLGGYVNNITPIKTKCIKCGHVREVKTICIGGCPNCKQLEAERIEAEREQAKAERKAKREAERERNRAKARRQKERAEKLKQHPCIVCGEITTRKKYCSDACCNRAHNKAKEIRRRNKISNAMVDKDITIEGLYNRDGGRCYLCGLMCSWGDYTVRDGIKISGDWYPSIDHVVPLARGGRHSWNNVKLAHRRCNYVKGDGE